MDTLKDLFEFIILGYCASEQKEWWVDLTQEERMAFWDKYIYPYFSSEQANIFLDYGI